MTEGRPGKKKGQMNKEIKCKAVYPITLFKLNKRLYNKKKGGDVCHRGFLTQIISEMMRPL